MKNKTPIFISLKSHIAEKMSSSLGLIIEVFLWFVATTSLVQAQVTSDETLSTKVTTSNNLDFTITNGNQLGGNLFHSFQQFSMPEGGSASFANSLDVQNIFSRVTGNSISEINGLIETNGSANLFLLNPNGIIFGRNAQLKVGGSFIASTASQINFADGSIFSASNPQTESLLTISMPIGLQFREPPGNIINRSIANQGIGLEVLSGKTLSLVGGDLFLEGGVLTTFGGRIELGSVATPASVRLIPINAGWALSYDSVQEFQDIHLSKGAIVLTILLFAEDSSDILLQGRQIVASGNSDISTENYSEAPGRRLTVKASESVEITEDSNLSTTSLSTGAAADMIIETKRLVVRDNGSFIATQTESDGRGGNLKINTTESVEVDSRGGFNQLTTQTFGNGDAGTLRITTGRLILRNGGQLSSSTFAVGNGGQIIINALESIEISGQEIFGNEVFKSGVFARTRRDKANGNGGKISINTGRLSVRDGGTISVAAVEGSTGRAGNLEIDANSLFLNQGTITAETAQTGREEGANITLKISDLLRIENESEISATANGLADGGNIDIATPLLLVFPATGSDGSDIIAKAQEGNGGNIIINAQGIFGIAEGIATQDNQSNDIDASSEFGASGQVEINNTIDPNRGLIQLPETVVDPNALIAQNPCKRGSESEFVITGRGGLPPSLSEDLSSEATQVSLVEPAPMETQEPKSIKVQENPESSSSEPNPIIPAQGWVFNEKGEVVLVAYDPTVTGNQRLKKNPEVCPIP